MYLSFYCSIKNIDRRYLKLSEINYIIILGTVYVKYL